MDVSNQVNIINTNCYISVGDELQLLDEDFVVYKTDFCD